MRTNRFINVSIALLTLISLPAYAQTTTTLVESVLKIAQESKPQDLELVNALESHLNDPKLDESSSADVLKALTGTTSDTETILKLFAVFYSQADQAVFTRAAIDASARRAAEEIGNPERVVPILTAIDKAQPAMNKFAWRNGLDCLKPYSDLLLVYVDHCPTDHPLLAKKLADIQIRHITAARFTLPPDESLKRMNQIDPKKLSRDKDREQLEYLKNEVKQRANIQPESTTRPSQP